ncbi:MAG: hypothetical protein CSB49_07750, partial [Proteobacteria bacterium]
MKRPVTVHAALLCGALLAAYFVWTRDRTRAGDSDLVQILNLPRIDELRYDTPDRKVRITRAKDGRGAHFWVDVEAWEHKRGRLHGRPGRPGPHGRGRLGRQMPRRPNPGVKAIPTKPGAKPAPKGKTAPKPKG